MNFMVAHGPLKRSIPRFYLEKVEFSQHTKNHFLKSHYDKVAHPSAVKGKGKAIPLQAWTGPEDSRKLRFPDFKTIDT